MLNDVKWSSVFVKNALSLLPSLSTEVFAQSNKNQSKIWVTISSWNYCANNYGIHGIITGIIENVITNVYTMV